MTKKTASVIFTCICIFSSAFHGAAENNASRDLNQILESGKLIVAMVDMNVPPFILRSRDGALEGQDADIARDIADKLEISLEIIKTDYFDDVVGLVAMGKADIGLSNLSITYKRAIRVKFTDPYRVLGITLLLNRMKIASMKLPDGVKHLEQLKNSPGPIGVVERSSYEEAARRYFPNAVFKTYKDYGEMLQAAEKGQLLMAVGNSGTINNLLEQEPRLLVKLQPFDIEGFKDHIAMAVGLENDHLRSWLNAYLTVKGFNSK